MAGHAVVIVGAGPTGLMLAGELALAGVDAVIVERRESRELVGWRALGFSSRTIEVFDQRGIADRFLSQGTIGQHSGFAWIRYDISDFPSRHPYGLALPQKHIERILNEWVEELKVPILRGLEVTGFAQDETGVDVALCDGRSLRAAYLVGCDGGRSAIRKAAGIDFAGWDATMSGLIAEVEMDDEPQWGARRTAAGFFGFSRPDAGGPIRAQAAEAEVGKPGEPTIDDLREAIVGEYGTDFGLRSVAWITRFTDTTRQAVSYRKGRVLLAGDAAHVHSPMGGQGLGVGVQDAVNLGWKLAEVVNGTAPDSLLDTYHAERHPIAARVPQNTMAQVGLSGTGERMEAARAIVGELLSMEEPRKRIAGMMSGLDIHYDLQYGRDYDNGEGHPLLGRRMPDLDLITANGPQRVYELLHTGRPVLLNFTEPGAFDTPGITGWAHRVQVVDAGYVIDAEHADTAYAAAEHSGAEYVDAAYPGTWRLPVLGPVPAPDAVLIRPDGHVAWVGDASQSGLRDALTVWFGPAVTA